MHRGQRSRGIVPFETEWMSFASKISASELEMIEWHGRRTPWVSLLEKNCREAVRMGLKLVGIPRWMRYISVSCGILEHD